MSGESGREGGKPRRRNLREVDAELIGEPDSTQRHSPPFRTADGWSIAGALASRLWNKSALGHMRDGELILSAEEVLFCHWNRHLPLPDADWIADSLAEDPEILQRAAALATLREPGDVLVLSEHVDAHSQTWGLRWNRGEHPNRAEPRAEVRWVQNSSPLDWSDLLEWTRAVAKKNRRAEVLVVDGEFDVTAYRLEFTDLRGSSSPPSLLNDAELRLLQIAWDQRLRSGEGCWIPLSASASPLPQLGVPQASGTWLNENQSDLLSSRLSDEKSTDAITRLLEDLLERGLWPRPGFKYGCRWRIYSAEVGSQHAPWLVVPLSEAPVDWNGACLAARLAAGVNKSWICAVPRTDGFGFLELRRWSPGRA